MCEKSFIYMHIKQCRSLKYSNAIIRNANRVAFVSEFKCSETYTGTPKFKASENDRKRITPKNGISIVQTFLTLLASDYSCVISAHEPPGRPGPSLPERAGRRLSGSLGPGQTRTNQMSAIRPMGPSVNGSVYGFFFRCIRKYQRALR